jgi:chaperonin cofactor prefoldin
MNDSDSVANSEFAKRIGVDLVMIKTTLKICAWIAGATAPFLLGLGAFLVSKVYETSTKIDRLTYRFDAIEKRIDSLEKRMAFVEETLANIDRKLDSQIESKRQDALKYRESR